LSYGISLSLNKIFHMLKDATICCTSELARCMDMIRGPGSSVGIATDYGLDGSGSNADGDEIFRLSRPALGPTQPPLQWVPRLSRG